MERWPCLSDGTNGGDRKKQQQAAARKRVMDATKMGEDVDGKGTRAETD
jgi:hypothetical protein